MLIRIPQFSSLVEDVESESISEFIFGTCGGENNEFYRKTWDKKSGLEKGYLVRDV